MRKKAIVGNWKMNKGLKESLEFASSLKAQLTEVSDDRWVGITPTSFALAGVLAECSGSPIQVGAQSGYAEAESGAYTGQVSMNMLQEAGVQFCLIAHSEQRQLFGETDETANTRVKKALELGLLPIFCIGESQSERESGQTEQVLSRQITKGLEGVSLQSADQLIVAYEPVWAIGTGLTATPEMAQETQAYCRSQLKSCFGDLADQMTIQYGGSVKPDNASELLSQPDVDGLLIGGASLKLDSFISIAKS